MADKYDVSVNLKADNSGFTKTLNQTGNVLDAFMKKVGKQGQFLRLDTASLSKDIDRTLQQAGKKALRLTVSPVVQVGRLPRQTANPRENVGRGRGKEQSIRKTVSLLETKKLAVEETSSKTSKTKKVSEETKKVKVEDDTKSKKKTAVKAEIEKPVKVRAEESKPIEVKSSRKTAQVGPEKPVSEFKQIQIDYRKKQAAQKEAKAESAGLTSKQLQSRVKAGAQNIALPEPSEQINDSVRLKAAAAEAELAKRGIVTAGALTQAFETLTAQAEGRAKSPKLTPDAAAQRLEVLYQENPDRRPQPVEKPILSVIPPEVPDAPQFTDNEKAIVDALRTLTIEPAQPVEAVKPFDIKTATDDELVSLVSKAVNLIASYGIESPYAPVNESIDKGKQANDELRQRSGKPSVDGLETQAINSLKNKLIESMASRDSLGADAFETDRAGAIETVDINTEKLENLLKSISFENDTTKAAKLVLEQAKPVIDQTVKSPAQKLQLSLGLTDDDFAGVVALAKKEFVALFNQANKRQISVADMDIDSDVSNQIFSNILKRVSNNRTNLQPEIAVAKEEEQKAVAEKARKTQPQERRIIDTSKIRPDFELPEMPDLPDDPGREFLVMRQQHKELSRRYQVMAANGEEASDEAVLVVNRLMLLKDSMRRMVKDFNGNLPMPLKPKQKSEEEKAFDAKFDRPNTAAMSPEKAQEAMNAYIKNLEDYISRFENAGVGNPAIVDRFKDQVAAYYETAKLENEPPATGKGRRGQGKASVQSVATVEPITVPMPEIPVDIEPDSFDEELTAALMRARTILENKLNSAARAKTLALKAEAGGDNVKAANYNKVAGNVETSAQATYGMATNKAFDAFRRRKSKADAKVKVEPDISSAKQAGAIMARATGKVFSEVFKALKIPMPKIGGGRSFSFGSDKLFDPGALTEGMGKVSMTAKGMAGAVAAGVAGATLALKGLEKVIDVVREAWNEGIKGEKAEFDFTNVVGEGHKTEQMLENLHELSKGMFSMEELTNVASRLEVITLGAMNSAQGMKLVADAAAATDPGNLTAIANTIGDIYRAAQRSDTGGMESNIEQLRLMRVVSAETRDSYFSLLRTGADGSVVWRMLNDELSKHAGEAGKMPTTYDGLKSALKAKMSNIFEDISIPFQEKLKPAFENGLKMLEEARPVLEKLATWAAGKLAWIADNIGNIFKWVADKIENIKKALEVKDVLGGAAVWELFKLYSMEAVDVFKDYAVAAIKYVGEVMGIVLGNMAKDLTDINPMTKIKAGEEAIAAAEQSFVIEPKMHKGKMIDEAVATSDYIPKDLADRFSQHRKKASVIAANDFELTSNSELPEDQKTKLKQQNEALRQEYNKEGFKISYEFQQLAVKTENEGPKRQGKTDRQISDIKFKLPSDTRNDKERQDKIEKLLAAIQVATEAQADAGPPELTSEIDPASEDKKDSRVEYKRDVNYVNMGSAVADSLQKVGGGGNFSGYVAYEQQMLNEAKKQGGWLEVIAGNTSGKAETDQKYFTADRNVDPSNKPDLGGKGFTYDIKPEAKTAEPASAVDGAIKTAQNFKQVADKQAADTGFDKKMTAQRSQDLDMADAIGKQLREERDAAFNEQEIMVGKGQTADIPKEKQDRWAGMREEMERLRSGRPEEVVDPAKEAAKAAANAKITQADDSLFSIRNERTAALDDGSNRVVDDVADEKARPRTAYDIAGRLMGRKEAPPVQEQFSRMSPDTISKEQQGDWTKRKAEAYKLREEGERELAELNKPSGKSKQTASNPQPNKSDTVTPNIAPPNTQETVTTNDVWTPNGNVNYMGGTPGYAQYASVKDKSTASVVPTTNTKTPSIESTESNKSNDPSVVELRSIAGLIRDIKSIISTKGSGESSGRSLVSMST